MIFNEHPHQCINHAVQSYRANIFAEKAEPIFKMRVRNYFEAEGASVLYYDEKFMEFFDMKQILSAATSGLLTVQSDQKYSTINYDATKFVKLSFFVALIDYNGPTDFLRATITRDHIVFTKFTDIFNQNGQLSSEYHMNTAFIIGFKPRNSALSVQIKFHSNVQTMKWKREDGWQFDNLLLSSNAENPLLVNPTSICPNCNENHRLDSCDLPLFTSHCTSCLVMSLDGGHHSNPCRPINKISAIREDIMASNALTLIRWQHKFGEGEIFYLANNSNFTPLNAKTKLISPVAESLITVESESDGISIALKQTSYKRCSFLLAYLDRTNQWRIRFQFVVTPRHGLLVFKRTRTLHFINGRAEIPPELINNTIAVFGLRISVDAYYSQVKVFANKSGKISPIGFNGYSGFFGINTQGSPDQTFVVKNIDAENQALELKRFNLKLYKQEPEPLSTFKGQNLVPSIALK